LTDGIIQKVFNRCIEYNTFRATGFISNKMQNVLSLEQVKMLEQELIEEIKKAHSFTGQKNFQK
jgi:hypothetical protein